MCRRLATILFLCCGLLMAFSQLQAAAPVERGKVIAVAVEGPIGPATVDLISGALATAEASNAALVVLAMDTPGGLDSSMRLIIKQILASPVPFATYVSPEGARAASAGTFILYASHIAAMAPATNLGAASPVAIGGSSPGSKPAASKKSPATGDSESESFPTGSGTSSGDTMIDKLTNDAAAYIRGLAQLRDRDSDFAERAVRDAASLSASEALAIGVVDIIAIDLDDLLVRIDGMQVRLDGGRSVTLATANSEIERITPNWRHQFLALISNPQIALVLMMIGIYGLFFEFTTPGFGVPGVAGLICLVIALYSFQMLPVNWTGVALIVLGVVLMAAEAFFPSFGVLGIGGVIAFVIGGLFLVDSDIPGLEVSLPFMLSLGVASALLLFAIGVLALRARRQVVVSGREDMIGTIGVVTYAGDDDAYAMLHGESWQISAGRHLTIGEQVRVLGMDGLILRVEPVSDNPSARNST